MNYCYDIELPEHKVFLNDYKIDTLPITNAQFLEFIEDGGYETYKYWLSDGWEKVKANNWKLLQCIGKKLTTNGT